MTIMNFWKTNENSDCKIDFMCVIAGVHQFSLFVFLICLRYSGFVCRDFTLIVLRFNLLEKIYAKKYFTTDMSL